MSGLHVPGPGPAAADSLEARVGDALDRLRSFRAGVLAPVLLGCIMLFDSWDSIAIAYVMPSLTKEWGISPAIAGTLISSGYVGQFIGAIVLGGLAERAGRMVVFIGSIVLMGVLALGCALSPNYHVLLAVRFVQGLAIGGALPVSITYVNELAPTLTRGRYFAIFQWLCMSGYAAASVSSTVIVPELGWRWLFGAGVTPLLLLPFVVLFLPESPRWLARMGRPAEAAEALRKLGGSLPPPASAEGIAAVEASEPQARIHLSALFSAEFRTRTIIMIALWFLTSFANFGLTTWVPSIYTTVYHIPIASALKYAAAASTLFLIATPVVAVLLDPVGRRPFAIFGTAIAAVALGVLCLTTLPEIWQVVALVISAQLCISIGSFILWPYTAESYPTLVRAVGLGVCSSTARAASMLTPLFVGVILSSGGSIRLVFGVLGLFAFLAMVLWLTATRETARVRLETL